MSKPMELRVSLQRAPWRALAVTVLMLVTGVFAHAQASSAQNVKDVVIELLGPPLA